MPERDHRAINRIKHQTKRYVMCLSLHMFVSLIIYLCTLFIFMASIKDIITMLCCVVDGSVRFESINDNYYWLLNIVNNNINNGYLRLWLLQWYGCMANNFYSYSYLLFVSFRTTHILKLYKLIEILTVTSTVQCFFFFVFLNGLILQLP